MKYCEEYYEGINHPYISLGVPVCDKCMLQPLTEWQYYNQLRVKHSQTFRYCDECWNYINLQTWTDEDGNKHTVRSERILC